MRAQTALEIDKILASYESAPESPVVISNVLLRHVGIPDRVWNAIEEKLAADQRAQQMEFEIQRAEKEKEKMQKEGEAIDNYNVAAAKNLTADLLRLRAIDATKALAESKNTKVIIIGGGDDGLPVILNDLASPSSE
jgi:regulator of protease activity HflC (stomatin/prohibitin superfamily)